MMNEDDDDEDDDDDDDNVDHDDDDKNDAWNNDLLTIDRQFTQHLATREEMYPVSFA